MSPNLCHSIPLGPLSKDGGAIFHVTVHTAGVGVAAVARLKRVIERCWFQLPRRSAGVVLDAIVVAPDRVEALLVCPARAASGAARMLAMVIGTFKSAVSQRLGRSIWASGFELERLSDQAALEAIRQRFHFSR